MKKKMLTNTITPFQRVFGRFFKAIRKDKLIRKVGGVEDGGIRSDSCRGAIFVFETHFKKSILIG